ncbi:MULTISPECIES: bacillithiol system redox-active protein YtxJ [Chitinophagaceae]
MNWNELTSEAQLSEIMETSKERAQVIFKHSTRCSISKTVWNRMERTDLLPENADYFYLDLIAHRNISNKVAEILDVQHESPQALVIKDGKLAYDADHFGIEAEDLVAHIG